MNFTNYHGHCYYCDGRESPEAYVEEAIRQQMPAYGFSSHAPLPYGISWPMQPQKLSDYAQEIAQLKQKYAGQIELYTGLEVDYIPDVAGPGHQRLQEIELDFTVGSVHFVDAFPDGHPWEIDGSHQVFLKGLQEIFDNDIQLAITRYYALIRQMIAQDCPDIVGHLDKIKIQSEAGKLFDEQAVWYQSELERTLYAIAQSPAVVEVNTRGMYKKLTAEPYPGYWVLERMHALDIPVMINADAHHPREITACFQEVAARLLAIGYKKVRVLLQGVWQDVPLSL